MGWGLEGGGANKGTVLEKRCEKHPQVKANMEEIIVAYNNCNNNNNHNNNNDNNNDKDTSTTTNKNNLLLQLLPSSLSRPNLCRVVLHLLARFALSYTPVLRHLLSSHLIPSSSPALELFRIPFHFHLFLHSWLSFPCSSFLVVCYFGMLVNNMDHSCLLHNVLL